MKYFNIIFKIILVFAIGAILSCENEFQHADLIIVNANIWTGNEKQPNAEAMAVRGDSIIAIGAKQDILKFKNPSSKIIDVKGNYITPGFIDTHVHFLFGGFNLMSVQLRDAKTPDEFISRISQYAKTVPKGTWILGGEWDGSDWETLPSKDWIDNHTPEHPVFITGLSGHIALANSLAMELTGVTFEVEEVTGGVIGRNDSNELTGIFKDNAMNIISDKIPAATDEEMDKALIAAMNHFASKGVTTVHNVWYPAESEGHGETFERALNAKKLITRIYRLDALEKWETRAKKEKGKSIKSKWLKTNGLKGMFDGALGSHTAAFFEPYADDPSDNGLFLVPEKNLYDWVSNADKKHLQVAVHAIGDRAINTLLNNYENIISENGKKDRRFRIEHVQHIAPQDIKRVASLNVIASMQPSHTIDDGRWAEKVIGPERIKTTYAFKSLIDAGAIVSFGSDWPVASASPLEGIYAAVTRITLDGKNPEGWVPKQKITPEEALIAYTKNGAYASFEENVKGTLAPGKLADFVIISDDITKVEPQKIKDLKILKTFVGGEKVFDANMMPKKDN